MAKSRNFSICLLKTGYNDQNALKDEHSMGEPLPLLADQYLAWLSWGFDDGWTPRAELGEPEGIAP